MSDYIKRDDAIKEAIEAVDEWDGGYVTSRSEMISIYLNDIPAADVRENVHGEWIDVDGHWECSVCRHPRFHDLFLGVDASYCGCCGADMRGAENG